MSDDLIGTDVVDIGEFLRSRTMQNDILPSQAAWRDDAWLTLVDENEEKTGEVRVAVSNSNYITDSITITNTNINTTTSTLTLR